MASKDPGVQAGPPALELASFRENLEAWGAQLLGPYIAEIQDAPTDEAPRGPKEINDPIWGTVTLDPLEIVILDSPLLQRLRRIRQLGLVHFVYPAANHTRFEHSLGCVLQVTRVAEAVNIHASETLIPLSTQKLLRLAVLCHDVGHGAMSHVSENALKNFQDVENITLEFADIHDMEPPSLSEIAAYYLIGSPAFRELLTVAETATRDQELSSDAVDLIQKAIIGKPIDERVPLLHEFVSGPFDADKLDYMARDAQMTGVPVVTDIPRLIQKVRAIPLGPPELPEEVQGIVSGEAPVYWLTGIALSGGRTLDELLIGRIMLFDKLHRHHKVRACEAMVASIFRAVGPLCEGGPALVPYRLDDAAILELDRARIAQLARRDLDVNDDERVGIALDIAERLRRRKLFVRAYAFAQNMPLDPYRGDEDHVSGLRRLITVARDQDSRGALVESIVERLREILQLLGLSERIDALPSSDLKPYVWVDPPQPPTETIDIAQAFLITEERGWLRFADDYAEAPSWTNAYLLTRDVGFVFTTAELAPYTYLATERVVRQEYGVRSPRSMYSYAKQDSGVIEGIRRRLGDAGFYTEAPHDIRPVPERLTKADVTSRLSEVAERLRGYQGPGADAEGRAISIATSDRMRDWLVQFEGSDLIDAALRSLEQLLFIDRDQVVGALGSFLEDRPEWHGSPVCPLGGPKDSSAIVVYNAGDLRNDFNLRIEDLRVAVADAPKVILADDFIGSGAQAISIIEALLGAEQSVDLREERTNPLSDTLHKRFLSLDIALVFAAGTTEGADRLVERCRDLGFEPEVYVGITDLPSALDATIYGSQAQRDDFISRCQAIGSELLINPAEGHDEAWAAQRALGYGNDGYLVLFPYNTPAQALTVLWASGSVGGMKWDPLFPRRKKV